MRPLRHILLPLAVLAGIAAAPACVPLALQGAGQILSSIAALIDFSSAFNRQRLLDRSKPQDKVAKVCDTPIGQCPLAAPQVEELACQCTTDKGSLVDGLTKKAP